MGKRVTTGNEGWFEGEIVGLRVFAVGLNEGVGVGIGDGFPVETVGDTDGENVAFIFGVGWRVGNAEGCKVGLFVGTFEGRCDIELLVGRRVSSMRSCDGIDEG